MRKNHRLFLMAALAVACAPAYATVTIESLTPTLPSPQPVGTSISWTATATNSGAGTVTFQFKVAPPRGSLAMVKDFNVGTYSSGTYTSQQFVWVPTFTDGMYQIQVVAMDFKTGESATATAEFQATSLVTAGKPVAVATANPLVALFSAPSCAAGSTMRVVFQQHSKATPATQTNWAPCKPPGSMNFEIAGMYPGATYDMVSQTKTGHKVTNGPAVLFKTGSLPATIPFPTRKGKQFLVKVQPGADADTTDSVLLHSITRLGGGVHYPDVATDLSGNIIWYYYTISGTHANLLTRPLADGTFLSIEDGPNWNPKEIAAQVLRQVDLAGNIVKETNTGIIQEQLVKMGVTDGGPCTGITAPAAVGTACLGSFHHDFIQTLPNGYSAVLADIEKIFPAGTQGDTSGLPVDIMGDMIIVLDNNWQVAWYFDTFEHAGGGTQLDYNRPAVLGEVCINGQGGCPPVFLLGTGIAPKCKDWLHANAIYYWPAPQNGTSKGDLIWSSRHQDWIMRVNYQDTKGTGDIMWRMGPGGDFTFNNVSGDIWPWFSHQHEVGMENGGTGPMTLFDNGNTRLSPPTGSHASSGPIPGLGSDCGPIDCKSRGMVLTVDESTMQVTPLVMQDLGVLSPAMGSAQLLSDGNYFFVPTIVALGANDIVAFDIEITPPAAGDITGTQAYNIRTPEVYRGWQMPSLYAPPTI